MKLQGKILVADDEKINVDFFQIMLTKLGFEVDVAYDGEEVLEKVKTFEPDLILLDLLMPKMSGIDVSRRLKSDVKSENIPIIILTAVNDIKEKVDMLELGIEDYITKPFNFIEIVARIRNILRSKFLKDEIAIKEKKLDAMKELEKSLEEFLKRVRSYAESMVGVCGKERERCSSQWAKSVNSMYEMGKEVLARVKDFEKAYDKYKKSDTGETDDVRARNETLDEVIKKNIEDKKMKGMN